MVRLFEYIMSNCCSTEIQRDLINIYHFYKMHITRNTYYSLLILFLYHLITVEI